MFSATSWALTSALRTSWMFRKTSEPVNFWTSLLELLDAGAALADDDAGARREDVDLQLVGGALHRDVGDAGGVQLLLEEATQQDVLVQPLAVASVLEPLRAPGADDPDAEADRMCFLAH
jgi:hypothetical protein